MNTHAVDFELSSSQYAQIADGSQTGLDLSGNFTFEAWIKLEQLPSTAGSTFTILAKNSLTDNQRAYQLFINSVDDKLYCDFYQDGAATNWTRFSMNTAFSAGDVGAWVHIAAGATVASSSIVFYKNGTLMAGTMVNNTATSVNNSTAPFCISARNNNGTPGLFFDGKIDDVRIWNTTRTQKQIQDNMALQVANNASGLVANWLFNNDYEDQTANNNDLTASNSPTFSTDIPYTQNTKTFTADGIVKATTTSTFTVDGLVVTSSTTASITLDGIVASGPAKTFTVDGIVISSLSPVRRNLVPNPKFQSNGNFWSRDDDFSLNTGSGGYISGGYVEQVSTGGFENFTTVNDANGYTVEQNQDYKFSFYFRVDSLSGNPPLAYINASSPYGTTISFISLYNTGGQWARATISFNSGSNTLVYFRLSNNGGTITARYSNFMLEQTSTLGDYFDGDTVSDKYSYDWVGSSNASISTETQLFVVTTNTFTVDGFIKATEQATFTIDAIIQNPDADLPENFLIYELMDIEPQGTLKNDAVYTTGYVQLTPALGNNNGQLEYSVSVPANFIIEADFYANGSADANWIYWGNSSTPNGEDSFTNGYIVALDEYTQQVQLKFHGTTLEQVDFPRSLGDGARRILKVVVESTRIYVYVDNVLCIDYTDTSRVLGGNLAGVGARTGGQTAVHRCYKLIAYVYDAPWAPTIEYGGLSTLDVRSVDTMKWQKDLINNQPTVAQIQAIVRCLATNMNLTHIAIAIPLDRQEDYEAVGIIPGPYMSISTFYQVWVDAIHNAGLGVIFRGNFNALEKSGITANWNFIMGVGAGRIPTGTPASAPTDGQTTLLGRIYAFITSNPTYFRDGDIFAPLPERTESNVASVSISSITRSGQTAIVTTSGSHNVGNGQPVRIAGADQTEYNGSFLITRLSSTQFSYTVSGSPATPATGTMSVQFGPSIFNDENSFLSHSGGITTNYADFFADVHEVSDMAFEAIGKDVRAGQTANNFSEVDSGWLPQAVFDDAGAVVVDHYGSTHTVFEMYDDLVSTYLEKDNVIRHQEWGDFWNGNTNSTVRRNYLVNFYNMLTRLREEGIYDMFNYWGGWTAGIGEGILRDVGTLANPEYELNTYGEILAQYFNTVAVPDPVGVTGLKFGFYLNEVKLKRPRHMTREFVNQKTDYTAITGKTTRDTGSIKEKYILKYYNLTKAQVDAMLEIINLNTPVLFTANGKDVVTISKMVIPYIGAIDYSTPGSDYRANLDLELIEEE